MCRNTRVIATGRHARLKPELLWVRVPPLVIFPQLTRVDVMADGDRYAGDPEWWAKWGSTDKKGGGVLIERAEKEEEAAPEGGKDLLKMQNERRTK